MQLDLMISIVNRNDTAIRDFTTIDITVDNFDNVLFIFTNALLCLCQY